MLKTLALLTLTAGIMAAQTYSFNPGVSCIAVVNGQTYQVLSCANSTSAPNADGSTASFQINQCYQGGWRACTITVTVQDMAGNVISYSGPVPVTVSSGLNPFISSSVATGSFTFHVQGCWGGGRSNPEHCQLYSVGSPSGNLTITH